MDLNIQEIITSLITRIPELVIALTLILQGLKAIQTKVSLFPANLEKTKTTLNDSFTESKNVLIKEFAETKVALLNEVADFKKQIIAQVGETLTGMQGELNKYQELLKANTEQSNVLARQNKVFMDIIANLISKDPEKIREGLAAYVSTQVGLSKEEHEKYPERLMTELPVLEKALKEALIVIGDKAFEEMLRKIGYERKEEKLPFKK